ncbi:heavy-metal-associated domain-containing protein [Porphyromonas circumdentaria]|uniref:Copper chaperone CopZ n=1 Tax=Porphyromonas circumdentaria TaxID=29524 RepID=A0A1T4LAN4_9PORP|nr:heavy-metal-associated domain-containing protein [Porphyromonas circumdentaria]MBB6275333.1 copper chaperone CopZ [Porphyromonas circumdentaria]MDO4722803.1 heavy-metal-associated domain-containing protein [Porphyromonas circumdentaria]SJZ51842.1 Copper chaperone CopZ [Porphyromonas circumdentaria]
MTTKHYTVEGMHCPHCLQTVQNAAESTKGVLKAVVSLEEKTLDLEVDDSLFDESLLIESIGEEGFKTIRK